MANKNGAHDAKPLGFLVGHCRRYGSRTGDMGNGWQWLKPVMTFPYDWHREDFIIGPHFRRPSYVCMELIPYMMQIIELYLLALSFSLLLVGGLERVLFPHILGIIIPTDEVIFFRGVGVPPSRLLLTIINHMYIYIYILTIYIYIYILTIYINHIYINHIYQPYIITIYNHHILTIYHK